MDRTWRRAAVFALAMIATGVAISRAPRADAQVGGSMSGELGAGGTAVGDISMQPGETDVVGVDLDAGSLLNVALVAGFAAKIELFDPSGVAQPVDFGASKTTKRLVGFAVSAAGKYHVRVSSADGTQGAYKLTAVESWRSRYVATLTSGSNVTFSAPAGGAVSGSVAATPRRSWSPVIDSLRSAAGDELLAAAIDAKKGVARLPAAIVPATGDYALHVAGGDAGATFRAVLAVKRPKTARTSIDLTNGLTPVAHPGWVSFSKDGVAPIFRDRCSGCHAWAGSYGGVASRASDALAFIDAGYMPAAAPPLTASQVALIRKWVTSGAHS